MNRHLKRVSATARNTSQSLLSGPLMLAFLPSIVLVGYWVGGEFGLTLMAVGFPAILGLFALLQPIYKRTKRKRNGSGHTQQDRLSDDLDRTLEQCRRNGKNTACMVLAPDDFDAIVDRYGLSVAQDVVNQLCERLSLTVRNRDLVSKHEEQKMGVVMAPVPYLNLDIALQVAGRLQAAIEKPITIGEATIYISASIGISLDTHFREDDGSRMVEAAELALTAAQRNGPSSIRSYSPDMRKIKSGNHVVSSEIDNALEKGQILPWFQPQISTDTGHVTGFEALARWEHPERGTVSPAEFLPKIQQAGKMERLGEVMLRKALEAVKEWDSLDIKVPKVGVNFSPEELSNPNLIKKIEWELDKFDLTPDRLAIEILETVVATSPDDMVARNISGLSDLGCQIDLDDFGTGHASISSIRRFDIQRLKIDRSFVMKVDQDQEQQRMVSAILLMAERLDLDTLAEGVETAGEHVMLSQLGCRHVQGFGIGKPMPFSKTETWVSEHLSKLSQPPEIRFRTG